MVSDENTAALINAPRRAWEDAELGERVALSGPRFAKSLGGEHTFMHRY
jgi:hypothetical protein